LLKNDASMLVRQQALSLVHLPQRCMSASRSSTVSTSARRGN
jgi:hypothetical protein